MMPALGRSSHSITVKEHKNLTQLFPGMEHEVRDVYSPLLPSENCSPVSCGPIEEKTDIDSPNTST